MTYWELFFRVLPHRPLQALAAAYWHLTRRKVRARNRLRVASADLSFAYAVWIGQNERDGELAANAAEIVGSWASRPRFTVLLHGTAESSPQDIQRSKRSLADQVYQHWSSIDDPVDPITKATAVASDFLVPLRAGDELSPGALFRFAEALQRHPDAAILYGDQDELDSKGRRFRPWFKPRWNREMFLAQDYVSDAAAVKTDLAREACEDARSVSELVLTSTARAAGPVVHVPYILCHTGPRPDDQAVRLQAVSSHVEALGASCIPGPFGTIRISWPLPDQLPLVSLIVPTKDRLELLQPCVESVLARTDYDRFEVLIVDNGSLEKRTADYLEAMAANPRVRILSYPGSYNFSAINNFAARQAKGAYLCLLNNDTEVVTPKWLAELMRYAVRPEIGAAGAKLLYEDGTIQHAGVVVGIGEAAGHAHRFLPADEPGYFRMPHVAQFVSAVTAACLVVDRQKFEAVGGLDQSELQVAFNDVDFCLKLERAGWRNVYVPHAILLHHESKSRGKDVAPANIDRYQRELKVLQDRWGTKTYRDPLHNPNLDRYSETFVIGL